MRITLQPSGREFEAQSGESLLEAALRSGLSVRYSCNSGTCGECRARVVAGTPGERRPHDYVLSQGEKDADIVLMCSTTPGSDMVLEAVEARSTADLPHQEITTQVTRIEPLSESVRELQLRTPRSRTLRFLAGQHVMLRLADGTRRAKSVASCPCNGMLLKFHVKDDPDDPFARRVFAGLRAREPVQVSGPYGDFVLDEESRRPTLFLAFHTGFAGIKSLLEHAISLELPQPLRLYWQVARPGGHYQENHCRSWREALDDYDYIPVVGGDDGAGGMRPDAWHILLERVIQDHPDLGAYDVYLSGVPWEPAALIDALLARRLPRQRLFVDSIW